MAELRQEVDVLSEQVAEMRRELQATHRLADFALSSADAARRARAVREPDPGYGGEIPLIPRRLASEQEEYEAAFRLYGAGSCTAAIGRFRAFVRAYPRSDHADNALFWTAECHLKLGDPLLAALTFERVHREFPDGNKLPDALYRQAVALLAVGNQNGQQAAHERAARELLQRILDEHPRWERTEEARRMLGDLRS